jgi:hypothetical protein
VSRVFVGVLLVLVKLEMKAVQIGLAAGQEFTAVNMIPPGITSLRNLCVTFGTWLPFYGEGILTLHAVSSPRKFPLVPTLNKQVALHTLQLSRKTHTDGTSPLVQL